MFTGLIEDIGKIKSVQRSNDDITLSVEVNSKILDDVKLGDSIAINGVCLTVTNMLNDILSFDVSIETLNKTSLRKINLNTYVNVERAMRVSDRLGGHIVSGHVDCTAILDHCTDDGRSRRLVYELSDNKYAKFIAEKGSVCIDGVSLTVNEVSGNSFGVNIIRHTWEKTIMQYYRPHQIVNIEIDVIARYVERMLNPHISQQEKGINYQDLLKL
ncbi:riboflavin synthase [Francisellaceae bacterium]|nr:riboflavin synthase [Francisellaceae bacterium]